MNTPTIKGRLMARQQPDNKLKVMHQDWRDLLFLHWEYDPLQIQFTLPEGLYTDTFNGKAYVGITPFYIKNLRLGILPPIPGISAFNEINVRTYVFDENGVPGVWFYSLDADKYLAVEAAKLINLPYRFAEINNTKESSNSVISFKVQRLDQGNYLPSEFSYRQSNDVEFFAESESLEFFLLERYYLFNKTGENKIGKIQVHHQPYPLVNAEVYKWDTNLLSLDGLNDVNGRQPNHIIMSPGVDVDIYNLEDAGN